MSDPIQETTETNGSRRKGLEAWAASIAARQQKPGPPPPPEQDGSGPAYARPGASQRIQNVKAVTGVQKGHKAQKNTDGVLLSRNEQKVQPELSLKEARELMLASRNLLLPSNGEPVVAPTKDMVLGVYYLTMMRDGLKGEGKIFSTPEEVETAYELGLVDIHAKIKVYTETYLDDNEERYEDGPRKRIRR